MIWDVSKSGVWSFQDIHPISLCQSPGPDHSRNVSGLWLSTRQFDGNDTVWQIERSGASSQGRINAPKGPPPT